MRGIENADFDAAGIAGYQRANIIGEIVKGVSPFFSYTESSEPISGATGDGNAFKYGVWSFAVNANCLARGDCFIGADRNVFGTVSYRF